MGGIFSYANMGNVRLGHCLMVVSGAGWTKSRTRCDTRCPFWSSLEKQLSTMRRFSSSKRSARVIVLLAEDWPCGSEGFLPRASCMAESDGLRDCEPFMLSTGLRNSATALHLEAGHVH
jgi:hypothetical protein